MQLLNCLYQHSPTLLQKGYAQILFSHPPILSPKHCLFQMRRRLSLCPSFQNLIFMRMKLQIHQLSWKTGMASFLEFDLASLLISFRKAFASNLLKSILFDLVRPFNVCILARPHLSPFHQFSHHFTRRLIQHRASFSQRKSSPQKEGLGEGVLPRNKG